MLEKQILAAFRKRQSPRTGFVHLFLADDEASDTIPVYENFLFAYSLFRQKTAECILEGQELIERLLAFQVESGNFPFYLHDFPRCWDFILPLKVAPLFVHLLRLFSSVIGAELKEKMEKAMKKMIDFPLMRSHPLWEQRWRALNGLQIEPLDTSEFKATEWAEWIITCQLADRGANVFPIPFEPDLLLFLGPGEQQEKEEPSPWAIEYWLGREAKDHTQLLYAAPFFPFQSSLPPPPRSSFREVWRGKGGIHTLAAYQTSKVEGNTIWFDLPERGEIGRELTFDASFFCNLSDETEIFIEGKKGTVFRLGDQIEIKTPGKWFEIRFFLSEGEGSFCGHILQGNRPTQTDRGYQAYDWQIALRCLRRSGPCVIRGVVRGVIQAEVSHCGDSSKGSAVDGHPHCMDSIVDVKNGAGDR